MTQATINWGLVYQEYTDPTNVSEAVRMLAESIDDAVTTIEASILVAQEPPAARVTTLATQVIPTGVDTAVSWAAGGASYDNHGMYNPAFPTRLTPTATGLYLLTASTGWFAAGALVGSKSVGIRHNTSGIVSQDNLVATAAVGLEDSCSLVWTVSGLGEYFEMFVSQNTAGNQSIGQSFFQALKLRDF